MSKLEQSNKLGSEVDTNCLFLNTKNDKSFLEYKGFACLKAIFACSIRKIANPYQTHKLPPAAPIIFSP